MVKKKWFEKVIFRVSTQVPQQDFLPQSSYLVGSWFWLDWLEVTAHCDSIDRNASEKALLEAMATLDVVLTTSGDKTMFIRRIA